MIGGLPNAMVAKVLNLQPFGPTGVVNGNQLSSVGQGLKKLFKPQPEYPRIFTLGDEGIGTGKQKRGSNTGVLPTLLTPPPPEPDCCMYPAEGLSELYSQDDLPDSVTITLDQSRVANRDGSQFVYGDFFGTEIRLGVIDGVWRFIPSPDVLQEYQASCLIDSVAGFTVEDNFADTYNLTYEGEFGETGEVNRNGLCSWASTGRLYYYDGDEHYVEFFYNGPPHRWIYIREGRGQDEGGGVWEKNDPQNGPSGTYSPSSNVTGNSFAGIGTITFTEA